MQISSTLRKRFCKDYNIPIALFDEPYFSERLEVVDMVRPCIQSWLIFLNEIQEFESEEKYFEYYNQVKDSAISHLKENPSFVRFNTEKVQEASGKYPKGNLYSPANDGKSFISIDMRKANFSALRYYDPAIFDNAETWENWLGNFTEMQHILHSKYIRQVIMGACNPGRQTSYEKYITESLYKKLENIEGINLLCLSNDEIVFGFDDDSGLETRGRALYEIRDRIKKSGMPFFRSELFRLEMFPDGKGYVKHFFDGKVDEYKCVSAEDFHIVVKDRKGIPITENDKVFKYNGRLAKYI